MFNFSPLGLMRVLSAMNLGLGVNREDNPILQSVISTEAGDRFSPKLPTNMYQPINQQVSAQSEITQANPQEELAKLILQAVAKHQIAKQTQPTQNLLNQQQLLQQPNNLLSDIEKGLQEGVKANIQTDILKQQLDNTKQLLQNVLQNNNIINPTQHFNMLSAISNAQMTPSIQKAINTMSKNISNLPIRLSKLLGGMRGGGKL